MGSASMDPAVKQVQLIESEICQLCTVAGEIFLRQHNLLELEAPIKFRVGCSKNMNKVDMLKAIVFALLLLSVILKAAAKPPYLVYGVIKKHNKGPPSTSTHPPPVNDPTRGCNVKNFCRHFTLSIENPSGNRLEAVGFIEVGAPLNGSELGTEAIAAGIAAWLLNNTDGNTSGRLSVSMDLIADVDSAHMSQLKAVSRGIANMGLDVQYRSASMSAEDVATLPPVDGNIAITVDTASNQVGLKFFTHIESLEESDLIRILEYAKTKLQAIHE